MSGALGRNCAAAALSLLSFRGAHAAEPVAPPEHRRGVEQTFLTYPEWFLVHSPAEYAAYVKSEPPSGFPFWGHVGQFWRSYANVTRATREAHEPLNLGYHVMIVVIGASTTAEYALRSAWETVPGRLAELTTKSRTPEDEFAARAAQEYVDFIRVGPWYEFDFLKRLTGLWRETHLAGPSLLRKWERKYALTTEYGVKALYGWAIKKATKSAYEDPLPVTAVVIDRVPEGVPGPGSSVRILKSLPDGGALLTLPRYEAFLPDAISLARKGVRFREIAGNASDAPILVSVLAPGGWQPPLAGARTLFVQPILTRPGQERVVFTTPVGSLAEVLRRLDAAKTRIEHVYDY